MKIFTRTLFMAVALMAFHVSMNAQVDNTFRFVDNKTGNEIPDGGTYTAEAKLIDKFPTVPGLVVSLEALFDISVENTSAHDAYVSAIVTTESMSSGTLQFCFPKDCETYAPVIETANGPIAAGASQELHSEWFPEEGKYGTAKFTIQLRLMALNPLLGTCSFVANGPKITVDCTYDDPAGISDATMTDTKTETSRYSLDGRKLTSPARGINIVRMADGTVRKVLTK